MRKTLYILTAMVMVLSMFLAACAPSATPTAAPQATEPVMEEATATTEAVAGDATATTEVMAEATATAAATATLTPYPVASCADGKVCVRWFVGLGTGTDPAQITTQEEEKQQKR